MTQRAWAAVGEALPEAEKERWQALVEATVGNEDPLKVALLGGFSVGKSSLINALLGEEILPAALEETTALPTFLEWGQETKIFVVERGGEEKEIGREEFQERVGQTDAGGSFCRVEYPASWLKGLWLVDLPGLGSQEATRREYTAAQIREADVVLYLLAPRGPDAEDLHWLGMLQAYGKRFGIYVSQWDQIEEAEKRGERKPSLDLWGKEIEAKTRLPNVSLQGVSKFGHGKSEIQAFLTGLHQEREEIRRLRFRAEIQSLLSRSFESLALEGKTLEEGSHAEEEALRKEIEAKRGETREQRAKLLEGKEKERGALEEAVEALWKEAQEVLREGLEEIERRSEEALQKAGGWERFLEESNLAAERLLFEKAEKLSEIYESRLEGFFLEVEWEALRSALPSHPTVEVSKLLQAGEVELQKKRLEEIEQALLRAEEERRKEGETGEEKEAMKALREKLEALRQEKASIAQEELPLVEAAPSAPSRGQIVGRVLGEIADLALLFLMPTTAASKGASWLGKGAKALGASAATAKKVVKTAKAATPLLKKVGFLEKLSLGYWGEKLGEALSPALPMHTEPDPQALAEQQKNLRLFESAERGLLDDIGELQERLEEKQGNKLLCEELEAKKARMEERLLQAKAALAEEKERVEKERQDERRKSVRYAAERVRGEILGRFAQRFRGMKGQLYAKWKEFWFSQVEGVLQKAHEEAERFQEQMKWSSEEKAARKAVLLEREAVLRKFAAEVEEGRV